MSEDSNINDENKNLFNLFELALRLSREAGELIFKGFSQPKEISTKSSSADIVTQTDKLCEDYIISQIREFYPNHAIIAEESHQTDGLYNITDTPTWVIDPVDGTNNFAHALPHVCVCIGILIKKTVVIGIVHNPILRETFYAIKGQGASGKIHTIFI